MVKKTSVTKVDKVAAKVKKSSSEMKQRRLSRRFHKLKVTKESPRGIVYVGHLPKGFNETELKNFFQQFGQVTKLRVSRSVKTARSRGYAFLEFAEKSVAQIASKAMNKYLMFGRELDVHLMDNVHHETFKHGNRDWKFTPTRQMFRSKKNAENDGKTPEQKKARVAGLLQKEKEKRDRLKELEMDYKFSGYQGVVDAFKKTHTAEKPKAAKAEKKTEKKEVAKPEKKETKKVEKKVEKKEVKKVEKKAISKPEKKEPAKKATKGKAKK